MQITPTDRMISVIAALVAGGLGIAFAMAGVPIIPYAFGGIAAGALIMAIPFTSRKK